MSNGNFTIDDDGNLIGSIDYGPPKLGIGIPCSFPLIWAPFFDSFMPALLHAQKAFHKRGIQMELIRSTAGPVDEMRNYLVNKAINRNCSHLIMVDSDMILPLGVFVDMLYTALDDDIQVLGALCFRRYPPFEPIVYQGAINKHKRLLPFDDYPVGDVLREPNLATGAACLLCDMDVFRKLPEPWFEFKRNPDIVRGGTIGEDIGFCQKAKDNGIPVYIHTGVHVAHIGLFEINLDFYMNNKLIHEQLKKQAIGDEQNNNELGGN